MNASTFDDSSLINDVYESRTHACYMLHILHADRIQRREKQNVTVQWYWTWKEFLRDRI